MARPWTSSREDPSHVHVWPRGDIIDHELTGGACVCGPRVTLEVPAEDGHPDQWLVIHHPLDARKVDE
jgi:hypothetical protein